MSSIPLPGRPVRGSETGRPIMALLDLLGRRWTLRVVWELRGDPLSFRALQEACGGMSASVLRDRLAELRDAQLVDRNREGYRLSALGQELFATFEPVLRWAERWAQELSAGEG